MLSKLSTFLLRLWGWTIKGRYPTELPKVMLVVIPHTSNWDFPVGILTRSAIRADIKFIGKDSLFRPPFGWLFKWLGGYPVNRDKSSNFVQTMVDIYNKEPYFHTVISPEGTRSRVDKLKTGFYYIAKGGHAAIVLCKFDWGHREVVFGEPFYPTDDKEADFRRIDEYFKGVQGRNPEKGYLYKS
ncbi:MAG: 1-acyl-sn-glycerol-3-phosphate acyltransferase [Saprospiraceae bacterium]|nr:1-acyl-sn-glycerol-3-phosphate acyltransferase [Saprospiraceae bacterium]